MSQPALIEINLEEDGKLRFASIDEIAAWTAAERAEWDWIGQQAARNDRQARTVWNNMVQFFNQVDQSVGEYHSHNSRETLQSRLQELFSGQVRSRRVAIRNTAHGNVIHMILVDGGGTSSEVAVKRAIAAMAHVSNLEDNTNPTVEYLRRATLAIIDYILQQRKPESTKNATQRFIKAANDELAAQKERFVALHEKHESDAQMLRANVEQMISTSTDNAAAAVAALEEVKNNFETQMGLQAPAQYWATKAGQHKKSADAYKIILILWGAFAVLSTIAAYGLVLWLVVVKQIGGADSITTAVLFFGALAVWTTGMLWAARIISRLFLSEHHLAIDAAERATMATTYLALTNQRSADEKDRALVLAALFRPTADGIVKDDGPPMLTPAALMAGLMTPGR